jgi:hypothetical protein
MKPDQRAAWHAYLSITTGLLPSLQEPAPGGLTTHEQFVALRTQVALQVGLLRDERLRLVAIADRAHLRYRIGDRDGSAELLRALARRLFSMSTSTPRTARKQNEDRPPPDTR